MHRGGATIEQSVQSPSAVVLIRPHHFRPNEQTRGDNAFQASAGTDAGTLAARAYTEATGVARALAAAGVTVHLFEDRGRSTPDSVFPNNWFSTHANGHVALFPMLATNRRRERRRDVLETLDAHYRVRDVLDFSGLERSGVYLEGTGSLVLDHVHGVAYAARSARTSEVAVRRFCEHLGYEPVVFDALDESGRAIYHTNVMLSIGTDFALVGLSSIPDPRQRTTVRERLESSGHTVLELSPAQVREFAANAIELTGHDGRVLALSGRARRALGDAQRAIIAQSASLLALDVPTIELAGGSIRCMIAGLHLTRRDRHAATRDARATTVTTSTPRVEVTL
ncbi:MAG: citrulline utilization hydrolase CtlX [Acidimicrobiales bacterium]